MAVGDRVRHQAAGTASRGDLGQRVWSALALDGSRISSGTADATSPGWRPTRGAPWDDLLERLRASRAVHMDETGWRTAGERRALWGRLCC